jgi:hypothetical protein
MPKFDLKRRTREDMEETEVETVSLEDTLESLKRNANAVDVHFQQSLQHLKRLQKRIVEESKDISEQVLQPKTRMMKWLTDHGLPVECSFLDFFEVFLDEHRKEHRLDVSKRTVSLNDNACRLFGYKAKDAEIHIFDLMEKLPFLYE